MILKNLAALSILVFATLSLSSTSFAGGCNLDMDYPTKTQKQVHKPHNFNKDMRDCGIKVAPHQWHCKWVTADNSYVVPSLGMVFFTAHRWGNRYNAFTYHRVRSEGCEDPALFEM